MRTILVVFLALLISCGNVYGSDGSETLTDQYYKIVAISCEPEDEEVDVRTIWDCYKFKKGEWVSFELILNEHVEGFVTKLGNESASLKKTTQMWQQYMLSMDDFSYDFHVDGSQGTGFRLEAEEHLAKQRVDYLMYLLSHFYEIAGVE